MTVENLAHEVHELTRVIADLRKRVEDLERKELERVLEGSSE